MKIWHIYSLEFYSSVKKRKTEIMQKIDIFGKYNKGSQP